MAWRATALATMPYMAPVIFAFRPLASSGVDTFGVDDSLRLYINFENTVPKGALFNSQALLHEASHILAEHSAMAELANVTDQERDDWNVAGDMAINDDLRDAGCALLASHGVFAKAINEPDYLTPGHYMEVIRRKRKAQRRNQPQQGQGQGQGQGQQGQGNQPGQDDAPTKGCGSGAGGRKGSHELGGETLGGKAAPATETEKAMVRINTAAHVRDHQRRNGIGSVPAGIAEAVERIMAPSATPWQQVLGAYVRRAVASRAGYHDLSYRRRNRRSMNTALTDGRGQIVGRVVNPGHIRPVPRVHFYRDTSGSVSNHDLAVATAEVTGIAQRVGIQGEDLIVTDVDVEVYESRKYAGEASIREVQGRGGTDMRNAIYASCRARQKPSVIVIATDGETPWPEERPIVPVVVLLINPRGSYAKDRMPEWAQVVEVNS